MSSFWDRQWQLQFGGKGSPVHSGGRSRQTDPGEQGVARSSSGRNQKRSEAVRVAARSPEYGQAAVWFSVKQAALKLGVSTDTIERRRVPWQEKPVPFHIRFKFLVLRQRGTAERRYFGPDLDSFLFDPKSLPRGSRPKLVPLFIKQSPKAIRMRPPLKTPGEKK